MENARQPRATQSVVTARSLTTLIIAAVPFALALSLTIEQLTFFVSDDAYYYLNVARNITHGAGSTFDGINPTNGYHPLWMLLLLPVYWLLGNLPELALRVTLLLQAAMVAGSVWLVWDVLRKADANAISLIVAVFLACTLFSPLQIMFNGLETDLVVLMIVAIVYADSHRAFLGAPQPVARQALFGLLLGLLVLARLDEAFLLVGIAIWSLLGRGPVPFTARLGFLCRSYWLTVLVFAALVSPYFVWNLGEFGHLTPISGTLKSTFPHATFRWQLLLDYAPYVGFTLLAGLALVPMHRHPDEGLPRPHIDLLIGLWIGCFLQVCWAVFFTSWGTFQWHFAAHIPTACLILSLYAARLRRSLTPSRVTAAAVAAAAAVVAFNGFAYYNKGEYHAGASEAAIWARGNTPPGTVFALRDAGVFAYFSDRPTINLDGLINGYEFQHYVREGRLMDYLHEHGVKFLADVYSPCSYSERHVWVRSYLPPRPPEEVAWGLTVTREAEAYRSDPTLFRPLTERRPICFTVWPLDSVWLETRTDVTRKQARR